MFHNQGQYNVVYHLLREHPPDVIFDPGSKILPKIPGAMTVNMFISKKEEIFLKIAEAATLRKRETYRLPGSDAIEDIREDKKRESSNGECCRAYGEEETAVKE